MNCLWLELKWDTNIMLCATGKRTSDVIWSAPCFQFSERLLDRSEQGVCIC